jgi:hypothetical protein
MERQGGISLIVVLIVTAVMIFLYGGVDYGAERFAIMDLHNYRAMANASPGIAEEVGKPYAYRLLGPYLVGLLGIPIEQGFYLLTVVSSLVLAVLFYFFLKRYRISPAVAAVTTVLFVLNKQLFGASVWNYFQLKDLLSMISVLVMFMALSDGRWFVFAAALLFGALAGEVPLIMVPVALVYLRERGRLGREWRRLLAAVLPAVAAFVVIRLLVPAPRGMTLLEALLHYPRKLRHPAVWFRLLVNPFVPVSLLPLVFFESTVAFLKKNRHALAYLLLVFASALLGSNNERLMAPAFVVFYLVIGLIVQDRIYPHRGMLALLVAAGFLSSLHHLIARYPLPDRNITIALSGGSLVVVSAATVILRRRSPAAGMDG